jgi:hypothetical protein
MSKEVIKKVLNNFLLVIAICISIGLGFVIGQNYHRLIPDEVPTFKIKYVKKSDINIAVDESNRLILIDNKNGDYVIYSDSIGNSIFNIYAKQIWNK